MKRNHNRVRKNGSAATATEQPKTVLLVLRRRSRPGDRVRLQFVKAKTGRVLFSSVFERELLTIAERAAEKDGMGLGQFIIRAVEEALPRLELEASQGEGRAVA
jgi:hypothetical protein